MSTQATLTALKGKEVYFVYKSVYGEMVPIVNGQGTLIKNKIIPNLESPKCRINWPTGTISFNVSSIHRIVENYIELTNQ